VLVVLVVPVVPEPLLALPVAALAAEMPATIPPAPSTPDMRTALIVFARLIGLDLMGGWWMLRRPW
jgi:hypothetical protein